VSTASLNYLHEYFSRVRPNPAVLELCGVHGRGVPYSEQIDPDLTAIVNGYGRPEYLPLVWEAIQYQTRRPRQTWIVQNGPGAASDVPREFLEAARKRDDTHVVDADLNLGCWFRLFLAALYCRTRYVAIFDDDTVPGYMALETALEDLSIKPGIYGGRGITLNFTPAGPRFWDHEVSGWPTGNARVTQVDFVGQLWVMETYWLHNMFKYLPHRLLVASEPSRECGEDMFISFAGQKSGVATFVFRHGHPRNARWSSLEGDEMGFHPNAMHVTGGLAAGDKYLGEFVDAGWHLLRF
jgi:hypothetical protein